MRNLYNSDAWYSVADTGIFPHNDHFERSHISRDQSTAYTALVDKRPHRERRAKAIRGRPESFSAGLEEDRVLASIPDLGFRQVIRLEALLSDQKQNMRRNKTKKIYRCHSFLAFSFAGNENS